MKRLFIQAVVLLVAGARPSAEPGLRVVVNEANPIASLSREELSELFLKKTTGWPDGQLVVPVDQLEDSEAREAFNRDIHHKSGGAVKNYWQQRIFSGRDVPPPEKDSDAAVIAFVKRHRGGIGYVMSPLVYGVRVVPVRK